MKELSIEERAQRYDEAIERAVNIRTGKCETTFVFTEGLFNYLFPELEESNGEEVREAMIDFFKHEREEGVVVTHYGVNIERMIAWLEKQGQTFTKKDVDDAWLKGMCDAKHELEKQGERKPQRMISAEAKEAMYGNPAWSEEDETRIKNILSVLDAQVCWHGATGKKGNPYQKEIDWLKSLKPQPKQEWSEEDKFKVQRICKYLDEAKKYYADITEVRECMDWLKSLQQRIGE